MTVEVDVEELARLYRELGSVKKVGAAAGLHPSTVHHRLKPLNIVKPLNVFTAADKERLIRDYTDFRDAGRLAELAESMGRTRHFIARQAGALGLTDQSAPKVSAGVWKYMDEAEAELIWDDFRTSSYGLGEFLAARGYAGSGFRETMQRHFGDEWDSVIESKAKRSTMYRLGRQVEYAVRDHLKANGYFVMRSPGSKSPIDLLAVATGIVLFVQCKRGGSIGIAEWNTLFALAVSVGAVPVLAARPVPRRYEFYRMDDVKDGSRRKQPMTAVDLARDGMPGVFPRETDGGV